MIKKLGKAILCNFLESQVKLLRDKHNFIIVAVAGSVGKTSTKLAIARILGEHRRVRFQDGNYNDRLTVPLVLFGHDEPAIFNVLAWLRLLRLNTRIIRGDYPYDVVVLELGTDGIGQMKKFAYLKPEIVVTTAVAEEHMEYFKTLDAVASEELVTVDYARTSLINIDDVATTYLPTSDYVSYGSAKGADYQLIKRRSTTKGQELELKLKQAGKVTIQTTALGEQGAKVVLAAAAVADMLGDTAERIQQSMQAIKPVPGRMQLLQGVQRTTVIDDTYNASPIAVKAALDVLYAMDAPQRIAILGGMNELGDTSQAAHEEVGAYCDPTKLAVVVTIGQEAERYLAPAAEATGCTVVSFKSPYEAGDYVQRQLQRGAVVLAEGSQNGVFAEEALKVILEDPQDTQKLVRQSDYWLRVKATQFPH